MPAGRLALPTFWVISVLFFGSAYCGADQTRVFVRPVLQALAPTATPVTLEAVHVFLRKVAHLSEYGLLALLWFGAFIARVDRTPRAAAWLALAVCLTSAFVDEAHQSMLLNRTGSARDFVLDAAGSLAVLVVSRSRREASDRRLWLSAGARRSTEERGADPGMTW
jgi:VanZ family protein